MQENTRIILTGAASGLGKSLVRRFLSRGHFVYALDINTKGLQSLTKEFPQEFKEKRLIVDQLDVTSVASWHKICDKIWKKWIHVDYALNVAGYLLPGYISEIPAKEIDKHIDTNTKGLIYGSREFAIHFLRQGQGHIINIASLAGVAPIPGIALYSASKFAVRGFSLALAEELKSKNVAVTVICPDAIRTPMLDLQKDYEQAALVFSGGHFLSTEEVADAIEKAMKQRSREVLIPTGRGILAKIASAFPGLASGLSSSLRKKGLSKQKVYKKA